MNNSIKALIGLVTTGTAVAGAFLANNLLNKGEEKSEIDSAALDAIWEKRRGNRVSEFNKVFVAANTEERKELAEIVDGKPNTSVIFDVDEKNNFRDPNYVGTAIGVWCQRNDDDPGKLRKHPTLNKQKICDL